MGQITPLPGVLVEDDRTLLHRAHRVLEHPSLAARLTSVVGTPIEVAIRLLPRDWYDRLHGRLEEALSRSLNAAIRSLSRSPQLSPHFGFNRALGFTTGAVGGFFGLPGLLMELPVSTTLMLRSIADTARFEGEDLGRRTARLECIKVFALGARTEEDDAADTGYYGVRLALALSVSRAMRHVAVHGIDSSGPTIVRLLTAVSSRLGVAFTEKAAAMAVPLVGAAGGAAVNTVFMQHYQETAWGHFTVRRLERKYGTDPVREEYERLSRKERAERMWR